MKSLLIILLLPLSLQAQVDSISIYTKQAEEQRFKNSNSSLLIARKLFRYGSINNSNRAKARAFTIRGIVADEKGAYDASLQRYDSAYQFASLAKDSTEIGRIEHHRGVVYKEKGQYDIALEHLTNSARLQVEPYLLSMTHMVMASVFNLTNNPASAKRYAWMAIRSNPVDDYSDAAAYVELGIALFNQQKLDSAVYAFEKSKQFVKPETSRDLLYTVCNNLGVVYYFQGKLDAAIENFNLTYEAAKKISDKKNMALGLMNIGDTYTAKGDLKLAERYLKEGLDISRDIKHKQFQRDGWDFLSNVYIKGNDWKQAFKALKMNQAFKDSILNENTLNKIQELQTKYETEKKEQAIKVLEAEALAKQQQIVVIIMSALTLLLAVFIYFSRRTLKLKTQMAEEKERTQKERFRSVMEGEEKERKRMARELHDGLGQMLSTARLMVSDMDETNSEPKVVRTLKILDTTITEMRNLSHAMMPIQLINSGLEAALKEIADQVNASGKLAMRLSINGLSSLTETISLGLYRCIQEVLNNAIKYSEATEFNLTIQQDGEKITVNATDNGKGFDTTKISQSTGIGWSNVYSRIELMGGQVNIFSSHKEGTTVRLEIPGASTYSLAQPA